MRIVPQSSRNNYLFILFTISIILFSFNLVFITPILAQEKQMSITLEKHTVKPNELFSVTVEDEYGEAISDVTVGIQNVGGGTESTNANGIAWLKAPSDRSEITIVAQKDGYEEEKTTIKIDISPGFIESLLQNQYTPIIIAVLAVISAILIVNFRQKRRSRNMVEEAPKEHSIKNCSAHGVVVSVSSDEKKVNRRVDQGMPTEEIHMDSKNGPKVEEIRISRPRKDKEIVSVKTEEDVEKISARKTKRKQEYDWFEGEDDIRYKIDKITGEIDEEGVDKWFEGIDDIRSKIDGKIKKKDKKKN